MIRDEEIQINLSNSDSPLLPDNIDEWSKNIGPNRFPRGSTIKFEICEPTFQKELNEYAYGQRSSLRTGAIIDAKIALSSEASSLICLRRHPLNFPQRAFRAIVVELQRCGLDIRYQDLRGMQFEMKNKNNTQYFARLLNPKQFTVTE